MSENNDNQSLLDLLQTVRDVVGYLHATAPATPDGAEPVPLPEMRVDASDLQDDLDQLQDSLSQIRGIRVTGTDPVLVSQTEDGFHVALAPAPLNESAYVPRETHLVRITGYDEGAKTYTVIEVNLEGDEIGEEIEDVEDPEAGEGAVQLYDTDDLTTLYIDAAGGPYIGRGPKVPQ